MQGDEMLREKMGFDNVTIMIPFCRSPEEADKVLEVMGTRAQARQERPAGLCHDARFPRT
jgi:phosphoenolpyruvate synthase/pyruvate phosphate dikinase